MSNTDTPTSVQFDKPVSLLQHNWSDSSIKDAAGKSICTSSIEFNCTEDTQDAWENWQEKNLTRLCDCWNILAGHDPASVVVLDRETAEEVKSILAKMYNDYETSPQDFGAAWIDEEDSNRIGAALAKLTASMGGEKV